MTWHHPLGSMPTKATIKVSRSDEMEEESNNDNEDEKRSRLFFVVVSLYPVVSVFKEMISKMNSTRRDFNTFQYRTSRYKS